MNNITREFRMKKHPANPLMIPDITSSWECCNVFNPSVIFHDGLFHMHYRAQGVDWISRIGYAVSTDGIHWNRLRNPVMVPELEEEARGVEDPRVTEIDGTFYMAYCGFSYTEGKTSAIGGTIYPMWAKSRNLINWERLAPMVRGEDNKDHMLFPRKVNGRFCAFHRRRPNIWLAYSDDMITWREEDMKMICGIRQDCEWENRHIGMNGVPIETDDGWLAFCHGANQDHVYRIGVMLLDKKDPSKVLARPRAPILWPEEMWEMRGDVPRVVFSCTNLLVGDEVWVYYAGADHVIGLATAKLADLLEFVKQ